MAKILIASPARANTPWRLEVFKHYYESLANQITGDNIVDKYFIVHDSPEIAEYLDGKCAYSSLNEECEYILGEDTHHWYYKTMQVVAYMRSKLLQKAREEGYDYLFMVDTDMILHPLTLQTLIDANKDIVAEVAWSKWSPDTLEAPTAWDYNCYDFIPDIATRVAQFKQPGLYKVGMTGACTLFSRKVLETGVDYTEIPNLKINGEDRNFCIKAAVHGLEIWADTNYPPKHIYRESEMKEHGLE